MRCWKSVRCCGAKHMWKSKRTKHHMLGPLLDAQTSFRVAGARDGAPSQKWAKHEGLQHFRKRWQAWDIWRGSPKMHFRGKRSTRDTWVRIVRRSGRRFPERGCILERPIFGFAKMILRDRCSTSYHLASLFRGRCSALDRWSGKIAKAVSSALNFPGLKEVSQNCFVFDVGKFEDWGSLADLFRFWRCQVHFEEVSQNSFVFKLADRQIDRQKDD